MANPISPPAPLQFHMPSKRRIIFAQERARHGQPGDGAPVHSSGISNHNPPTAWKEPPVDITLNPQVGPLEYREPFGVASGLTGQDRATEYMEIVIAFNWRMHGLGPLMMFALLGEAATGAGDHVGGYRRNGAFTGQYLHHGRGGVKGTRTPTYTFWVDQGDGTWLMLPFATPTQLTITWNPGAALAGALTLNSWWPIRKIDTHGVPVAYVDPPKAPGNLNLIGTGKDGLKLHDRLTSVRTLSQQAGRAAIFSQKGGRYRVPVISGEFVMSRPLEALYAGNYRPHNVNGQTENSARAPFDFCLADLDLTGSATLVFDRSTSPSLMDDFLVNRRVGSAHKKNSIRFTDANTNSMLIQSWPWKWTGATPDATGSAMKLAGTFTAENDLGAATDESAPHLSILEPKVLNFEGLHYVW